jgi:hypothetical protein
MIPAIALTREVPHFAVASFFENFFRHSPIGSG